MTKIIQVCAIGRITFKEILRDKVLYNIVLLTALLLGVAFAASHLSFITPERVVIDFGFSALNISCAMIAIFHGAGMITKEFERRTIFVSLARPISRFQFLLGKFLGLWAVIALNWSLISVAVTLLYTSLGGHLSLTYFTGLFFMLLQGAFLLAITLIFACFSTASESVIIMIGFYLIGNNISDIQSLLKKLEPGIGRLILETGIGVLPNLEHFNLRFNVTYHLPVEQKVFLVTCFYALVITVGSLFLSGYLIERKEA